MVRGPLFQPLTNDQVESIHLASMKVLEDVGIIIRMKAALQLLADTGASVDLETGIARIPTSLIEEGIKKAPQEITLYSRDHRHDADLMGGKTYLHPTGGTIYVIDSGTGESRQATIADLEEMARVVDVLENIHLCAMITFPNDIPPEVRDIYAAEIMLRFSSKHLLAPPYNSRNLNYIIKLATTIVGDIRKLKKEPLISIVVSPDSPLQYSEEVVAMVIESAKIGIPISILPTPLAGGTSPVTLAGTLVQLNAEILAGNLLAQLTNPGTPVTYSPRPTPMDMSVGTPSYGAIEYGMMSAASVQLARHYGLPSDVGGFGTNSKMMDEQAAFEKALSGLLPALAGTSLLDGAGLLEADMASSLEQLVIDDEVSGMISRAVSGMDVGEETLALDVIRRVGPRGHFLKEEHTRRYLRREHFIPVLFDRNARQSWQKRGGKSVSVLAKERVTELLRRHEPAPLDKEIVTEFQLILANAMKELVH